MLSHSITEQLSLSFEIHFFFSFGLGVVHKSRNAVEEVSRRGRRGVKYYCHVMKISFIFNMKIYNMEE